jgi:cellulose biosynthesis protein BcsQ
MKTVAAYSIKGGVGKTAFAVNFAYAAALSGRQTLVMDLDPQGAAGFYFRTGENRKLKSRKALKDAEKFFSGVRQTDYDGLDILPSGLSFRNLDLLLSSLKKSRKRLAKLLKQLEDDYDMVVVDAPPNMTLLAENIFGAADLILVPVVPTTLSRRTYEQLLDFFHQDGRDEAKVRAFFCMVEKRKKMHRETMSDMREAYPGMLTQAIPYAADVEKMGIWRAPLLAAAPRRRAAQAYRLLCSEVLSLL